MAMSYCTSIESENKITSHFFVLAVAEMRLGDKQVTPSTTLYVLNFPRNQIDNHHFSLINQGMQINNLKRTHFFYSFPPLSHNKKGK